MEMLESCFFTNLFATTSAVVSVESLVEHHPNIIQILLWGALIVIGIDEVVKVYKTRKISTF